MLKSFLVGWHFNTSHVNVNPDTVLTIASAFDDFNTSHVNVNPDTVLTIASAFDDFNTSHVNVNLHT